MDIIIAPIVSRVIVEGCFRSSLALLACLFTLQSFSHILLSEFATFFSFEELFFFYLRLSLHQLLLPLIEISIEIENWYSFPLPTLYTINIWMKLRSILPCRPIDIEAGPKKRSAEPLLGMATEILNFESRDIFTGILILLDLLHEIFVLLPLLVKMGFEFGFSLLQSQFFKMFSGILTQQGAARLIKYHFVLAEPIFVSFFLFLLIGAV